MLLLTELTQLKCAHMGLAIIGSVSQSFVHIAGAKVAVSQDPSGKAVAACPMTAPKPCTTTRRMQTGHSGLLFIQGKAVCLSSVFGLTDYPAPYTLFDAHQAFVETSS
jgi:hypothetical protein